MKEDHTAILGSALPAQGESQSRSQDSGLRPWDLPGGPVVRTLRLHCQGPELRSHKPLGTAPPKKESGLNDLRVAFLRHCFKI